jgi:hypothetical protein
MFDASTSSSEAATERAARHGRILTELAEIGIDLARALRRQVLEASAGRSHDNDPGLAFARVSRAVRQTLALEARLEDEDRARTLQAEAERAARRDDEARVRATAQLRDLIHKDEVEEIVARAIEAEGPECDVEALLADLHERLEDEDDSTAFADHPIGEQVSRICRDLGLTPDWSLWEDED